MSELEFDLHPAPSRKPAAGVAGWMVALTVITFLGIAAVLALHAAERMYYRGQLPSDSDAYSAAALLP